MTKASIFVYGTLRQGGTLDIRRRVPGAVFVSKAALRGVLYDLGAHPGMQIHADGNLVTGEVYHVTDEMLKELDEIEGFDEVDFEASYYFRRQVQVTLESGASEPCWVYECNPKKYDLTNQILSGDWIEYARSKTDWPVDRWPDEEPWKRDPQ